MSEWTRLETESEIEELMDAFMGFHDAYLVELHYCSTVTASGPRFGVSVRDEPLVRMYLQGARPPAIELLFVGAPKVQLGDTVTGEPIEEACIYKAENRIYWTTGLSGRPPLESDNTLCASARRMYWRRVEQWTGARLRYLDPELEIVQEVDLG